MRLNIGTKRYRPLDLQRSIEYEFLTSGSGMENCYYLLLAVRSNCRIGKEEEKKLQLYIF